MMITNLTQKEMKVQKNNGKNCKLMSFGPQNLVAQSFCFWGIWRFAGLFSRQIWQPAYRKNTATWIKRPADCSAPYILELLISLLCSLYNPSSFSIWKGQPLPPIQVVLCKVTGQKKVYKWLKLLLDTNLEESCSSFSQKTSHIHCLSLCSLFQGCCSASPRSVRRGLSIRAP